MKEIVYELLNLSAAVTNVVTTNSATTFTNLDQSPSCAAPAVDQLVTDWARTAGAGHYVLNESSSPTRWPIMIVQHFRGLDQFGYQSQRSGHLLEGQGSPAEQCALLVYLLRSGVSSLLYLSTS